MVCVRQAREEPLFSQARELLREYAATPGVDLCVQDFERELASLPGSYAPPEGRLLLAFRDAPGTGGDLIGCVALRRLEEETCEMKRLYVRPAFRGAGAGRKLAEFLIAEARRMGYSRMRLDTLPFMLAAHQLYRALGFREIPAYLKNPTPNALCFELALR
jgi:GNAT superfamily N-acetyltransferase